MYFEAKGSYVEAEDALKTELEEHPDSQLLLKRQVALEKTKGNTAAAIDALRKYIDIFQTDREAWEELADLYLQACPSFLSACPRPLLHWKRPWQHSL